MGFIELLQHLQSQVRDLTGRDLIWKDADPASWHRWPVDLSQHRSEICLKVKADPNNLVVCCRADNLLSSPLQCYLRTCPFGMREWVIPLRHEGQLLGCFYLGVWQNNNGDPQEAKPVVRLLEPWLERVARARREVDRMVPTHTDPRMEAVLRWMDENLSPSLSLSEAARQVHLSPSRLRHRMVEVTSGTFGEHLREKLMKRAGRRLLMEPRRRIVDIALDLGWNDLQSFHRSFKNFHGRSPGQWRRELLRSEA